MNKLAAGFTVKDYDNNMPRTHKTLFWDSYGSLNSPKPRDNTTADAMKTTNIKLESKTEKLNAVSNNNTSNISPEKTTTHYNTCSKIPVRINRVESSKPTNRIQRLSCSSLSLLDRLKKGSYSEPTFYVTKDRGDNITLLDICREEEGKRRTRDTESPLSKKRDIHGCIYVKEAENIYKSEVEAKIMKVYEGDVFKNFTRISTSKNKIGQNKYGKNCHKSQTDEAGDFEIAIYLSGLANNHEKCKKQNPIIFENMQVKHSRIQKKKQLHANKNNVICDKNPCPSKSCKAKKLGTSSTFKTRLTHQINKPSLLEDLSDDDADTEYELDESGSIVPKEKTNIDSNSKLVRNSVKLSDSGQLSLKSRKSTLSTRSRITSRYSSSRCSTDYEPKITEDIMQENYEMIFKNYASTNRHSGEVIPRKINTEWMRNAGVINEFMTQKEADDAFKNAAGTRITMNVQEYKDFLISLSLKMKLPYYEIYRRMCGF